MGVSPKIWMCTRVFHMGSVLGPLLFWVYIKSIHLCVEPPIQVKLFADDCVVYTAINIQDDQLKLNNSLHSIDAWCARWGLRINTSKTAFITFANKKKPLDFTYSSGNVTITRTDKVKCLGITLTSNLIGNRMLEMSVELHYRNCRF